MHSFTRQPAVHAVFFQLRRWVSGGWQVSSYGRVSRATSVVDFGRTECSGYRRVNIGGRSYYVHRLVAAAFLEPPPDADCWQVNHLGGNPSNNHLTNLQYVTDGDRQRHPWATNLSRQPGEVKLRKAVLWRPCGGEAWTHCISYNEAARLLGVPRGSVSQCCCGLMKKSCGNSVWYEFKAPPLVKDTPPSAEVWQPAR